MQLATFKVDPDIWQQFKAKAEAADTNASTLLKWFISSYLDGSIDPSQSTSIQGLDERIDARLEPLLAELAELRGKSIA